MAFLYAAKAAVTRCAYRSSSADARVAFSLVYGAQRRTRSGVAWLAWRGAFARAGRTRGVSWRNNGGMLFICCYMAVFSARERRRNMTARRCAAWHVPPRALGAAAFLWRGLDVTVLNAGIGGGGAHGAGGISSLTVKRIL